jgi:hypothetical protein
MPMLAPPNPQTLPLHRLLRLIHTPTINFILHSHTMLSNLPLHLLFLKLFVV